MKTEAVDKICNMLSDMSITDFDLLNRKKIIKNKFYFQYKYEFILSPTLSPRELYDTHIMPFYEELYGNHTISVVKQTEIIKTYLKKLSVINLLFKKNKDAKLFFQNLYEPNSEEYNWIILAHYIYVSVINEIQFYCLKNNIDFESICENANFKNPTFHFHSSLFSDFKENQNKEEVEEEVESADRHENIFSNNGFEFFEHLLKNNHIRLKGTRGHDSDVSFFYRVMFKDKYIHAKSEEFRTWYNIEYTCNITKITSKNGGDAHRNRDKVYEKQIAIFKSNKAK